MSFCDTCYDIGLNSLLSVTEETFKFKLIGCICLLVIFQVTVEGTREPAADVADKQDVVP